MRVASENTFGIDWNPKDLEEGWEEEDVVVIGPSHISVALKLPPLSKSKHLGVCTLTTTMRRRPIYGESRSICRIPCI